MEYRNGTKEIRATTFLYDPRGLTDMEKLKRRDDYARKDIERLENALSLLKQYRLELAKRAQELETMNSHIKISLVREKHWKGAVFYFITKERIYSDGSTTVLYKEKYSGTKRHEAIKNFKQLKKEFPQCDFYEDITKRNWE